MSKTDDIVWIRARLEQWGIWCNFDENLPPRARLMTGGGDYVGDDRDNEDTNSAIICIRKFYPQQAKLLNILYVPDARGWCPAISQFGEKHLGELGISHKRYAYALRKEAEKNVAFFLMGRATDRGNMALTG